MAKFKLGNVLWEFYPKKDEFKTIDEAWNYLSDGFARARTNNPDSQFKVYMWIYELNKYGFEEWTLCKSGYAQHKI